METGVSGVVEIKSYRAHCAVISRGQALSTVGMAASKGIGRDIEAQSTSQAVSGRSLACGARVGAESACGGRGQVIAQGTGETVGGCETRCTVVNLVLAVEASVGRQVHFLTAGEADCGG